jgi:hypothetical protein
MAEEPSEKNNQPPVEPIRTYKSDVERLMKQQGTSLADIALAEEKKRTATLSAEVEEPKRTKLSLQIGIISLALVILASLIFYATEIFLNKKPPAQKTTPLASVLVSVDDNKEIDVANQKPSAVVDSINSALKQIGAPGLTAVSFVKTVADGTKNPLGSNDFLAALNIKLPGVIARSLRPEFVFGFYRLEKNEPFLVLKISDYESAFAGMLEWENTIADDLNDIFIKKTPNATATTSQANLTLNSTGFSDRIIRNRDSRLSLKSDGSVLLLYSFIDNQTVIITGSEPALAEVGSRLIKRP